MFRAYDPQRECLVAVKLFKLDLPPERVHRLVYEFERLIAADLTHPSMCAPLVTGMTGVSAFLAQDFVAAESLDLAVREYGPAPAAEALRVAAQLAGALDCAAVANISHGALHPRDALLSSDETRLTGIGVAYALEQVGVSAPVRRPYTAPERIAGAAWDRRADIFSLAALIHELLWARRVSGTGSQAAQGLTAIEGADVDALRAAFACALADDPRERFGTALGFAEALAHAFPGITITTPQSAVRSRPSERVPRGAVRGSKVASRGLQVELEPRLPLDEAEQPVVEAMEMLIHPDSDGERDLALPISIQSDGDEGRSLAPAGLITGLEPEPMAVLVERPDSAVWPLMLALTIGLATGFGGGYWTGARERPAPAPAVASAASSVAGAPAGREFTERAVAEPVRPAPAPPPGVVTPPASPQSESGSLQSRGSTGSVLTRSRPTQSMTVAPARPHPAQSRGARSATPSVAPPTVARTGGFTVASRPTGAKVYLDGKLIGTTPLSIPAVPAGDHAVRLESEGYRRWSTSVKVIASGTSRVTASMER